MQFQRSCLYHPTEPMRVIEEDQEAEYQRLLSTGAWFDHPTKALQALQTKEGKNHEKPIRQYSRKRCRDGKDETKSI